MAKWINHNGTDEIPEGVHPDAVLELDFGHIGCVLPAGAVVGWDEVKRYKDTGDRNAWRPSEDDHD